MKGQMSTLFFSSRLPDLRLSLRQKIVVVFTLLVMFGTVFLYWRLIN